MLSVLVVVLYEVYSRLGLGGDDQKTTAGVNAVLVSLQAHYTPPILQSTV